MLTLTEALKKVQAEFPGKHCVVYYEVRPGAPIDCSIFVQGGENITHGATLDEAIRNMKLQIGLIVLEVEDVIVEKIKRREYAAIRKYK